LRPGSRRADLEVDPRDLALQRKPRAPHGLDSRCLVEGRFLLAFARAGERNPMLSRALARSTPATKGRAGACASRFPRRSCELAPEGAAALDQRGILRLERLERMVPLPIEGAAPASSRRHTRRRSLRWRDWLACPKSGKSGASLSTLRLRATKRATTMPGCSATMRTTPWIGASTPVTRAFRVYSP
jgi:hypothetical protein